MPSVLFVCTANQFRSPIAAACLINFILQENSPEKWRVESAGTWANPGSSASSLAIAEAHRLGLTGLEQHVARRVSQNLLDQFDLIIVMETGHLEGIVSEFRNVSGRVKLLSEITDGVSYNIQDPFIHEINPGEIASELQALIQKGGKKILGLARSLHRANKN